MINREINKAYKELRQDVDTCLQAEKNNAVIDTSRIAVSLVINSYDKYIKLLHGYINELEAELKKGG